jgi:hypothetical protein
LTTISAALLITPWLLSAQNSSQEAKAQPADYNPYPPGILPPDLNSEIARVLLEIDIIEARAVARQGCSILST